MKAKLLMVFIGVVVTLLMAGLEIVQGEDTYPVDIGYPAPIDAYPVDEGYPIGYPEPLPGYLIFEVFDYSVSEPEAVNYPELQDSSIEPQYRNGRNLWQEIVYQFSKLLELMK